MNTCHAPKFGLGEVEYAQAVNKLELYSCRASNSTGTLNMPTRDEKLDMRLKMEPAECLTYSLILSCHYWLSLRVNLPFFLQQLT
jgi:hypothetical protein